MNRRAAALLLVAALVRPAAAAPAPPPELLRAVQAPQRVAYRGELVVSTWDSAGVHTTLVTVEHDPPDWSQFEYRPVGSTRRWMVLRRGSVVIQFDPAARSGTRRERQPSDEDALLSNHLPWLLANYHITASPGVVLGRAVSHLEFAPQIADRPARRMDVDGVTGVVLRSERTTADGRLGEFSAFIAFEPMPRGWRAHAAPAGLQLRVEPSAQTLTGEAAARRFVARPVEFVSPEGFHRVADYMTDERGPVLHTMYTDGLGVIVVSQHRGTLARPPRGSQAVRMGGGMVWTQEMGLRTLVHWTRDGWVLTAVGDVNAESLLRSVRATGSAPAPRLIDRLVAWVKDLGLPF